jgi:hypothetical protein
MLLQRSAHRPRSPLSRPCGAGYVTAFDLELEHALESHSVFGTLWAGLGMGAYFTALLWINVLLSTFLPPLFEIPLTWGMDRAQKRVRWNDPENARRIVAERNAARNARVAGLTR